MAENEMVGWHHQLNAHEFEQTLGDGEGQGSLMCCSLWGCKESDPIATEQPLNYSAKPGGTSDFALRCFFLSHIFLLFLPDHQGSRPVLLPQSSTWIQERPHRSPQDFVHTCLRLFTVLPWPLSNHHVSSSMVSISPISEMTEPSWGPSSENIMCVCRDVFFHLFV